MSSHDESRRLKGYLSTLSDDELLRIVNVDFAQYRQETLDYAREELFARGISVDRPNPAPPYETTSDSFPTVENQVHETDIESIAKDPDIRPANTKGLVCKIYQPDQYGSFWRRYWANVVDGFILSSAVGIASAILPEVGAWFGIIAFPLYQIGLKGSRGTTLGYYVCGLRVVSISGANPTINQIAVRQISAIFSLFALGLGYLWIAFDAKRQSWHDKIAGTYVIRTDAQPAGTIVVPRAHALRVGIFVCLLLMSLTVVGMVAYLSVGSEGVRQTAEVYVEQSVAIRNQVGNLTGMEFFAPFTRDGSRKEVSITASGEKGTIDVTVRLRKEGEIWLVTDAYIDPHGTHVPLDVSDPVMAKTLYTLAEHYHDQRDFARAEPLYQRSISLKEKILGPEHPEVGTALNDLAETYREQRKYGLAEPLYQRALAILEHAYGPSHNDVARVLNNLALLYDAQRKYTEAEPLYQRSLSILEEARNEHPDEFVQHVLKNYAGFLRDTNRAAEAAKLEARAEVMRKDQKE